MEKDLGRKRKGEREGGREKSIGFLHSFGTFFKRQSANTDQYALTLSQVAPVS